MNDNYYAWNKAFAPYGIQVDKLDYFLLEGKGRFEVAEFFIKKHPVFDIILENIA